MIWYVRLGSRIVGFVIASSAEEAIKLAYEKYPTDIESGNFTVEKRKIKRGS